jgi:hypothetical protein
MTKVKRIFCTALAVVMMLSALLLSGCSTTGTAVTVGDTSYSTGEYLAYLYNAFYQIYYQNYLYYYAQSTDVWEQTYPYGEGDDAPKLKLADWIRESAKDTMLRQVAVSMKLKEYGLDLTEEQQKTLADDLASISSSQYEAFLKLGFNKDSYARMYKEVYFQGDALFYGLYDKGGQRAMSEEEIREYFDKNFISYKSINVSLVDSDSKEDMSESEQKAVLDKLDKYLKQYQESGDFDAVIEQYNADEKAASEDKDDTDKDDDKSDDADKDTADDKDNDKADDADKDTDDGDAEDDKDTVNNENRVDIDANTYGDEDFTNAIKENLPNFGDAKVFTCKKGGSLTATLMLRLDPEAERGKDDDGNEVDYFADSRKSILRGAKYEEFREEIDGVVEQLKKDGKVSFNERIIDKCDPKSFVG